MPVQHRTAEVVDRGPTRRRLTFSTPLTVSLVVVVVMAVVAGAILLGPRGLFGIGAASPSPGTPSPTASPISPVETSTVAPTASPPPTPTVAPTPTPMPTPTPPAAWTGLGWTSGPASPDLGEGMTARIDEALWWSGRYVGVGSVRELDPESHSTLRIAPAAFVAEGGSAWQLVLEGEWEVMADQGWERAELQHLVDLGDELLAISGYSLMRGDPPSLWSSTDGLSWSAVASASWAEIWEVGGRGLLAVDGDSSGIVAVGFEGGGCCLTPAGVPVVVFSPDGRTWQRISPPSMTIEHCSLTSPRLTPGS